MYINRASSSLPPQLAGNPTVSPDLVILDVEGHYHIGFLSFISMEWRIYTTNRPRQGVGIKTLETAVYGWDMLPEELPWDHPLRKRGE